MSQQLAYAILQATTMPTSHHIIWHRLPRPLRVLFEIPREGHHRGSQCPKLHPGWGEVVILVQHKRALQHEHRPHLALQCLMLPQVQGPSDPAQHIQAHARAVQAVFRDALADALEGLADDRLRVVGVWMPHAGRSFIKMVNSIPLAQAFRIPRVDDGRG